ncbi:L-lactate permease [Roseitranquillus sediminis]|uniref:L-lactate permease n=1 Tax=Roseitranquillus sediminis TaxID=2809051 RepID=UPI001D0CD57B|nr:L-lactate permease [Roseitranquillus sediminis]MBM9596033.1 L-lactate permease [Roseitranquillus sediminis]
MSVLLAATPLAVILVGMGWLRRSAVVAGSAGLAVALILAATAFRPGEAGEAGLRVGFGALAEAVHATATILWIILPALAIFEFQRRAGAIERIRDTLAALADDRRIQAILIAWFFGLFMEGAAGFGTPVALAAPLLVGLGYNPVRAVALALLGHAAGVSFGAVGTPVLAQVEVAGLAADEIAPRVAALHALAGPVLLLLMVRLAGDAPLSRSDLAWSGLAALCFFGPSLALAYLTGPELPTLGGALVGTFLFVLVLRRHRPSPGLSLRRLLPDLAPYLLILLLVLATRLIPPLQLMASGVVASWSFADTFSGSFQPLYHPGTMLFLGFFGAALVTGRGALIGESILAALRRLLPVAAALLVMLALSRLMVHAGMIATLASAASGIGPAWPLIAPLIGVLGTFISGSATASNILFTELQLETAQDLSLPPTFMAAAQAFGSAIGNVIAPHNIIAGSATVGLIGREGDVMAHTARPCALYVGIGGAVVFGVVSWI